MMLLAGANLPLAFNKEDQIVQVIAEYERDSIGTKKLTKDFITECNRGVYRLSLKKWSEHPHFSQACFDENINTLLLSSMTDRGFNALVEGLNEYRLNISEEPIVRVNLNMITTASDILKRKIRLNEYEDLFTKEISPVAKENLDKLNVFLKLVLPDFNEGRDPDINKLAKEAGIDVPTARDLMKELNGKFRNMGDRMKK